MEHQDPNEAPTTSVTSRVTGSLGDFQSPMFGRLS